MSLTHFRHLRHRDTHLCLTINPYDGLFVCSCVIHWPGSVWMMSMLVMIQNEETVDCSFQMCLKSNEKVESTDMSVRI